MTGTFQKIFAFIATIVCALTAGCTTPYPMGLDRAQWEALPPEKQAEYQAQQHALDQERQRLVLEAQLVRQRQEEAHRLAERERLQNVYANARYGDIVRVTVQGGTLQYHNRQHPYHPFSFELAKGESRVVHVEQAGQIQQVVPFNVRLSDDGNTLFFDDGSHDRIVLTNLDWGNGQSYMPGQSGRSSGFRLVGATYHVRLKELPGAPQRVIIENR
jgi:hypothetical protein